MSADSYGNLKKASDSLELELTGGCEPPDLVLEPNCDPLQDS